MTLKVEYGRPGPATRTVTQINPGSMVVLASVFEGMQPINTPGTAETLLHNVLIMPSYKVKDGTLFQPANKFLLMSYLLGGGNREVGVEEKLVKVNVDVRITPY